MEESPRMRLVSERVAAPEAHALSSKLVNRIADLFEDLFGEGFELPRNALRPESVERLDRLVRTGAAVVLPTGEILGGRFKISELLGVGTNGLVYTAADQQGGWKTVAVKVFHPGLGDSVRPRLEEAMKRLEGEHDPSVLGVIAAGDHAGQFYVVAEHIPTHLGLALADGAIGLSDAWTVFDAVLDGLAFLHRGGLAHGDLKPTNVLLRMGIDQGPEPVLADWAQGMDPEQGLSPETLFHMPPEQVADPFPTPSHDVYAAGVLLFQLIAGHHPFDLEVASGGCATSRRSTSSCAARCTRTRASGTRRWRSCARTSLGTVPTSRSRETSSLGRCGAGSGSRATATASRR